METGGGGKGSERVLSCCELLLKRRSGERGAVLSVKPSERRCEACETARRIRETVAEW